MVAAKAAGSEATAGEHEGSIAAVEAVEAICSLAEPSVAQAHVVEIASL